MNEKFTFATILGVKWKISYDTKSSYFIGNRGKIWVPPVGSNPVKADSTKETLGELGSGEFNYVLLDPPWQMVNSNSLTREMIIDYPQMTDGSYQKYFYSRGYIRWSHLHLGIVRENS